MSKELTSSARLALKFSFSAQQTLFIYFIFFSVWLVVEPSEFDCSWKQTKGMGGWWLKIRFFFLFFLSSPSISTRIHNTPHHTTDKLFKMLYDTGVGSRQAGVAAATAAALCMCMSGFEFDFGGREGIIRKSF